MNRRETDDLILGNELYWTSFLYDSLLVTPSVILGRSPSMEKVPAVNAARAVRVPHVCELEPLFPRGTLPPGFYVDPLTPESFVESVRELGYRRHDDQEEVWRVFSLDDAASLRTERANDVTVLPVGSADGWRHLDAVLGLVQEAHHLSAAVVLEMKRKLPLSAPAECFCWLALVGDTPAAAIGLGLTAGRGYIALKSTSAAFRRRGLMTLLELEALSFARERGVRRVGLTITAGNSPALGVRHAVPYEDVFHCHLWARG